MNAMENALFNALMDVMGKVWHDLETDDAAVATHSDAE